MTVVGEAANGEEAFKMVGELRPDVTVLDLTMEGADGFQAIERITESIPDTKIVVLSMHDEPEYVREAVRSGAHGYVFKSDAGPSLLTAIRLAFAGDSFVPELDDEAGDEEDHVPLSKFNDLSAREKEVLKLIAEGMTNRQAAEAIGVGVKSVETYRLRIRQKLGLSTRAELVRFALRAGLLN